jgi:hypothetical protein
MLGPMRTPALLAITAVNLTFHLAACGGGSSGSGDAGRDAPADDAGDAAAASDAEVDAEVPSRALGLNDVTFLFPLPESEALPVVALMSGTGAPGTALVDEDLFDRVVTTPADVLADYADFHLVALRFDLCDRANGEPCPVDADGVFRAVFQPLAGEDGARDIALHGFYPIPNDDLPAVVAALRALAALQDEPVDSALAVSPAFGGPAEDAFRTALRDLVLAYAAADNLSRLTLFAELPLTQPLDWVFRGVELVDGDFADIVMVDSDVTQQTVLLAPLGEEVTYGADPLPAEPEGFSLALADQAFASASEPEQNSALEALAAVDNPLSYTSNDVQCVTCHTSTALQKRRGTMAGQDPLAVDGAYASDYNLSIEGSDAADSKGSLRALGWFGKSPKISQRVVNETAHVLGEIDARFP